MVGSFEVENNILALKVTLKVRFTGSLEVENDIQTEGWSVTVWHQGKLALKVSLQLFGVEKKACLWNARQSWGWRWHSDVEGYSSLLRKACVWHARKSWDCRWHSSIAGYVEGQSITGCQGNFCTKWEAVGLKVTFKHCRLCWRSVNNWLPREPLYKVTGWRWHSDVEGSFLLSRKACLWNARQSRGWRWHSSILGYVEGQSVTGCQGNLYTKWQAVLRLKVTFKHCRLCWRSVSNWLPKEELRTKWQAVLRLKVTSKHWWLC